MDLESLALQIARSENLPVLPQIVPAILKLVEDPDSSARAMEKIIEREPAVSAKLLRVANSSYYGGQKVPSINRAISLLGVNTVRSLVISIAYQQVTSARPLAKNFNKLDFWRHSVGVGTGARVLAKIKFPMRAEELYGAGMLHDVGMLVMERFAPHEFDEAIRLAQLRQLPLHQAEQNLYGYDHAVVGGILAEKWGLSQTLTNAIRYHHSVMEDSDSAMSTSMVSAADYMAHLVGLGNNSGAQTPELDTFADMNLELPKEQYEVIAKVVVEEIDRAQQAFQIAA